MSSLNETEVFYRHEDYFAYTANLILCLLYVIVFVCNLIGNLTIWFTIPFRKSLRSPMNFLLLNLAFTHIVSGAASLAFCFLSDIGAITSDLYRQKVLCGLVEGLGLFFTSCGANLFTLCGISFNRFLAIMFPTKQGWRIQTRGAIVFNLLTWLMSVAIVCPSFVSFKYDYALRMCIRAWGDIAEIPYRIIALLISSILPTTFLFITFLSIVWKRHFASMVTLGSGANRSRNSRLLRAEKILGIVILTFLIFWSPFFCYWGLNTGTDYFGGFHGEISAMRWLRIIILITSVNGVLDPFIYMIGSRDLRSASLHLFLVLKGKVTGHSVNRVGSESHQPVNKTSSFSARNLVPPTDPHPNTDADN